VSVIKALGPLGALFAKGKLKHSYPPQLALQGPADLPQHAPVVRRHRQAARRRQGRLGATIRERALRSIEELGGLHPHLGPQPPALHDAGPPRLGAEPPARWGVPLTCFVKKGAKPTDPDFLLRNEEGQRSHRRCLRRPKGADVWYTEGFKDRVLGTS
jgi:isoleucyl-tRNA synthetase